MRGLRIHSVIMLALRLLLAVLGLVSGASVSPEASAVCVSEGQGSSLEDPSPASQRLQHFLDQLAPEIFSVPAASGAIISEDCAICLSDFEAGEVLRR